jgi:hypothetical protein
MLPYESITLDIDGQKVPAYRSKYSRVHLYGDPAYVNLTVEARYIPETQAQHDERKRQELIAFAKTGAPPAHAWVDTSPTYSATLAARDEKRFCAEERVLRCVPRMTDQEPWIDYVKNFEEFNVTLMKRIAGACGLSYGALFPSKQERPASLSDFAIDFHASNQRWWSDPATGEKIDRNMGEMIMLVTSEIAECMEGERKDLMDTHLPHRKMAEVELADAIIRIADIVGSMGRVAARTLDTRLGYIAGYDTDVPANKGEALKRICDPLAGITHQITTRPHHVHFTVNKFARVWHRIERYAAKHGYDLWGAVFEKMEYNKTRADHTPAARLAANGKKF